LDILEGDIFLHNAITKNVANYQDIIFFEEKNKIPHGSLYFSNSSVLQMLEGRNIQTLATFVSSVKSVSLASQNKAVSACRSIIEKRIDALCEVVDEKEKDLLLKTKEILLTDIKNFHF
jgi:hypothetical protein